MSDKRPHLSEEGVLHVPMALITILLVLTGVGMWAILHHWKSLMETQLRIDRCTGKAALELKADLEQIGSANRHIQELRAAEGAALLVEPDSTPAFRTLIGAEALHQDAIRASWILKQARWVVQAGCGHSGDLSDPLPSLSWTRKPADTLGEQPLQLSQFPRTYFFEVRHFPRASAAEVEQSGGKKNGLFATPSWYARWSAPHLLPIGAGFR